MNIYEKTDSLLETVLIGDNIVPFYYGMPEFSSDNPEPSVYIVYDVYEVPLYQGDGAVPRKHYNITFNIFSEGVLPELNDDIEQIFTENGYIYTGGGQVGGRDSFPYKLQHYKEFTKDMEV